MKTQNSSTKNVHLPLGTDPKIIIIGRGANGRKTVVDEDGNKKTTQTKHQVFRLRKDTMKRVRSLVAGPTYLAVEILLERACEVLAQQRDVEMVKAHDLNI